MRIKKTINGIKTDIMNRNFRLGVTELSDDSFDISSAFGEIFIRVVGDEIIKFDFNNEMTDDVEHDMYNYMFQYIVKNWITE